MNNILNFLFIFFRKYNIYFFFVLLFLLALIKSLYFSKFGFGLLDEGENLHNGLRIINGELPYRDFYTLLPPLDNVWPALAFKLFGISIFAPRLLSSIVFAFLPAIFFLIANRKLPTIYSLFPAVLIIFLDLNIERIFYFSFIFGGIVLFINSLSGQPLPKIIAGALLGIGGLIRLDLAGGFFLGVLVSTLIRSFLTNKKRILRNWFKECFGFIFGFVFVMLILFLWLIGQNLLEPFAKAFFINSLKVTQNYSLPFPSVTEMIPTSLSTISLYNAYSAWFGYIILGTYFLFFIYLIKNWHDVWLNYFEFSMLFLIGLFISPYMLGRNDLGHLVKGGIPFLLLGTLLIFKFTGETRLKVLWVRYIVFIIPLIIFIAGIIQSFWWVNFNDTRVDLDNGVVYMNSKYPINSTLISANSLIDAVSFIKSNSKDGEPFLAVPYMAGLYFLTNRPSKTYVDNIFASFLENEQKFVDEVEGLGVNLVIYDPNNGPQSENPKLRDYYPRLDAYIMENFEIQKRTPEGWLFMRRKL